MTWAPDYVTSAELKAYTNIPEADDQDDAQVALAVTTASRSIDRAALRQFGQVDTVQQRYYTAQWHRTRRCWTVEIDDVMDATGLLVDFDSAGDESFSTSIMDFVLTERNAPAISRPWTGVRVRQSLSLAPPFLLGHHGPEREDNVRVTALYGWTAVPDTIKEATLLQANRFLARRNAPFGVAGSPDAGTEIRLLPKLDPDVALSVRPYYRWWGAR